MIHSDAGDSLHVGRVLGEDVLVIFRRKAEVTQGLLDPGHIHKEVHIVGKIVQTGSVDLECGQWLVQAEVDLAELEESRDHRLLLDGRLVLSLRVPQHSESEVAFTQSHLPEPVLVSKQG